MVGAVLREQTRAADTTARYGGEEFVILMPETDAETARLVAQRLLNAIAAIPWPCRPVTLSCGIVTAIPESADAGRMISDADEALYHSKRAGAEPDHPRRAGRPPRGGPGLIRG